MDIRKATRSDSENLARIARDNSKRFRSIDYSDSGWSIYEKEIFPRAFDQKLNSDNFLVLIYFFEGWPAGYLVIKDSIEIIQFFIGQEYQNRLVEKSLLNKAVEILKVKNESVYFFVNSQVSYSGFYEKLGFVSKDKNKWQNGRKLQLMEYFENES